MNQNYPKTHSPKVSIGLAVFNGEKYLAQAIQSILDQTFTDFELIISDNASTDRSAEICQEFAALDSRIRYHRNETNIGGANNENQTFRMSKGEYFRWAAHDDLCAPELIEKEAAILDQDPTIVLCTSMIVEIDEKGNYLKTTSRNNGASSKPYERFGKIASSKDFLEETYGLMRADILRKTRLQLNYTASDRTLMCELSLYGRFHEIPEPLFYKRFHPGNLYLDWRTRMAWFDIDFSGKIVFPFWTQFLDYFVTIGRVPLGGYDRLRCYLYMLGPWLWIYGRKMVKDLLVAFYMLLHSSEWRKKRYARTDNWS
jgi:glycosyltransferase involved in cell wall biosynthesis